MRDAHPILSFAFFLVVVTITVVTLNPIMLIISITTSFIYSIVLNGKGAIKFNLAFVLPMMILIVILNPITNGQGMTILFYFWHNPVTLESIFYGVSSGMMLGSIVMWFSCFNAIMTSDKLVYLFGRILPGLSLIFSMVMRFIPRFKDQIKIISNSQKYIGRDVTQGTLIQKVRNGIKIISIMITWALENAVDTADSMKARGYGLPGRSTFAIFKFEGRDRTLLIILVILSIATAVGWDSISVEFFPQIAYMTAGAMSIVVYVSFLAICTLPLTVELADKLIWRNIADESI